ncbi:MAG: type II toxin-antitoxin system RelE/ParE family toxin [Polyangiales bacterium]
MKRQRAVITEPAQEDLDGVLGYLVVRNADAALALLDDVEESVSLLAQGLLEGREVTLSTGERVRRFVVRALVIYYYRRDADALRVLHVRDARREPLER